MDLKTVFANESIYELLLSKYLHQAWQDCDADDFTLKCVSLIYYTPSEKTATVKSIIKHRYPFYWERIEKLLTLR